MDTPLIFSYTILSAKNQSGNIANDNVDQQCYTTPMDPIILASGSPRRQDFFRLMGLPFTCIPAMIDETPLPGLSPQQAAEELARRKALAVAERSLSTPTPLVPAVHWIFAADTMVVLENEIFGKPADRDDARRMLERLAGRRHEVITAMALCNTQRNTESTTLDCRSVVSEVAFAPPSPARKLI